MTYFAENTAKLFSEFRVNLFASMMKKHLVDIVGKKINDPTVINLNKDNVLYLVPSCKSN